MGERPKDLPPLTLERLGEIRALLYYESSIEFSSYRAHEAMWMLVECAEEAFESHVSRRPRVPTDDPMFFESYAGTPRSGEQDVSTPSWLRGWLRRGEK